MSRKPPQSSTKFDSLEKLERKTTEKPKASRSDSDEEERDAPRARKQKKKAGGQSTMARLLSEDLSDDSDSDALEIIDASGSPGKRKRRGRSRSKSITPPPALPQAKLQLLREVVHKTLAGSEEPEREPSPTLYDLDESTDTIILDPELARIANSVARKAPSAHPEADDAESDDKVVVKVKWRPHPENKDGKESETSFRLNRNDNFRDLFDAVAEDAEILVDKLIMSYNSRRFFPSVTPNTLKLWGEVELVACDQPTWEYLRAHQQTAAVDLSDAEPASPSQSNAQESDAESEAGEEETFKLILRSAVTTKDIVLTVRQTTTCGAIVKAFLKRAGLADKYAPKQGGRKSIGGKGKGKAPDKEPQLQIDGDKMGADVAIGEADLEDGDQVEVVGL
ncbi:hypothetical protein C8J57DRAFT_1494396 [Mycena rebaudengoi]|nr:hypothetical protein C8J57DRAFT_1494396 [Mycena rebaudengoi]